MIHHALLAAGNPITEITTTFGVDWPKFISQVVLFLIVAFLLRKFAFGPIQKVLEDRRNRIEEGLKNAEKAKIELAQASEKASQILSDAGAQAVKVIEEARAAAAAVGETERQKAIADAATIISKAREAGEAEVVRLKGELRKEFGRLVAEAAARSTANVLTGEQRTRLADDAVRQLSA